jgi:sigma-54 specific flagellar transcriptional regulator A
LDGSTGAVLVIDTDAGRQAEIGERLAALGFGAVHLAGPGEWRYRLQREADIRAALLGPCSGAAEQMRLYEMLREERVQLPVILCGAPLESVRAAEEEAAGSFVRGVDLPLETQALGQALERALRYAERQPRDERGPELFRSLVGRSDGIRKVRELIQRVAASDSTVLILGEAGTGKEVVARNLHYHSNRRGRPFVAVNCGAVPQALLEGELFGQETGAGGARPGRFEQAAGGTLFLDEIGELSLALQVKLLRVLTERTFERAGGGEARPAEVRLIVATTGNLERDVREGRFREDLYYRVNVFPIVMPPLRERADDIPLLVTEINARLRQERGTAVRFSPEALATLQRYAWPGNVRELANLMERLAMLHGEAPVDVRDLPPRYRAVRARAGAGPVPALPLPTLPADGMNLKEYLGQVEYGLIVQALTRTGGVVAHAAQLLGLRRTTLVEKLHKYGVRREAPARAGARARARENASG